MKEMKWIEAHGLGPSHGTLTIYSAPRAVIRHIEWTIANVLGVPVDMNWKGQPLEPSTSWMSINWRGSAGVASRMASELSGWHYLRFEIYEAPTRSCEGSIYFYLPQLGIYRGNVSEHGDLLLNEHQISAILREKSSEIEIVAEIEKALGKPWDEEIECYRRAIHEEDGRRFAKVSV